MKAVTTTPAGIVTHKIAGKHTHTSAPGKSHHEKGSTHTGLGHSGSPGNSGDHTQAGKPGHPDHPPTPTGKDDTPAQGKGNSNGSGNAGDHAKVPTTKGPPATTPAPQKTLPTPTVPTLPGQAQKGLDRSGATPGPPDAARGVGQGLSKH